MHVTRHLSNLEKCPSHTAPVLLVTTEGQAAVEPASRTGTLPWSETPLFSKDSTTGLGDALILHIFSPSSSHVSIWQPRQAWAGLHSLNTRSDLYHPDQATSNLDCSVCIHGTIGHWDVLAVTPQTCSQGTSIRGWLSESFTPPALRLNTVYKLA